MFDWQGGFPTGGGGGGGGTGFTIKGAIDCSVDPNYPAANQWDTYFVSGAGHIGGAAGKEVEVGDWVVAIAANPGGTEAAVGSDWSVWQVNVVQATETTPGIAEIATLAESLAGTDDERFITPKKLKDAFDAVVNKVIFVDNDRVDAYVESGSWLHPYKTLQSAVNAATTKTKIVIKPTATFYNEDVILDDKVDVVIDGGMASESVGVTVKSVTINQTTLTRVALRNLKVETGNVAVTALTYNDGTNCLFENVTFRNDPAGGGVIPVIDIAGVTASPPTFINCSIYNDGTGVAVGGATANGWVQFVDCYEGADLVMNGDYNVKIWNSMGWKTLTHHESKLFFLGSQAESIVSDAPNAAQHLLYCDNFSLRKANMTQGAFNKTGLCHHVIGFGDYDTVGSVINGTRDAYTRNMVDLFVAATKVIYVDKTRTDIYTEDGSIARPFKTLAAGNTAAVAGDTVFLYPGNYNEFMTFTSGIALLGHSKDTTSITSNNNTIVMPAGGNITIKNVSIIATGTGHAAIRANAVGGDYIVLDDVNLTSDADGYPIYANTCSCVIETHNFNCLGGQSYFEACDDVIMSEFSMITLALVVALYMKNCNATPTGRSYTSLLDNGHVFNLNGAAGERGARIENSKVKLTDVYVQSTKEDALDVISSSEVYLNTVLLKAQDAAKLDLNVDSSSTVVLVVVDFTTWNFAAGASILFKVDPPTVQNAGNPNAAPALKGLFSQECRDTTAGVWYKQKDYPDGTSWEVI